MIKADSQVVDSRVVELTLNNSTFERNATTSISTIDKLKKALDFSDSGKGLDSINDSVRSININVLTEGVRSLKDEFSALDVIGIRTLTRLTDKVENAAEALVKGFTVEPVSAGWNKYAEKTTAVQTIMASTAEAFEDVGEQTEYVYKQLDKLSWFTDETSYSFTDMVGNIGKFTSNSVDLDVAVTAMQGIANWAAISGQNAESASRAMYNLAQAISVGSVKLIDWKSIQNANMATTEFKQTALDTAVALGTLKQQADGTYLTLKNHSVDAVNFTDSLKDEWFTSQVLLKTLDAYGGYTDKLYELYQKTGLYTSELLGYLERYENNEDVINQLARDTGLSAEELKKDFDELSTATYDLGKRSFRAAQEAKTFAEALDATKEAAGTAWAETFELIFGDYERAKKLWTDLAEILYQVFVDPVWALHDSVEEAMGYTDKVIDRTTWAELEKSGLASPAFKRALLLNAKQHGVAVEELMSNENSMSKSLINFMDKNIDASDKLGTALERLSGRTSSAIADTTDEMEAFRTISLMSLDEDAFNKAIDSGVITVELLNDTFDKLNGTVEENAESVNSSLESIRNEAIRVLRSQESGYSTDMAKRFEQLAENGFDPQAVQDYVNLWYKLSNGTWDTSEATMAAVDAAWSETHALEAQNEAVKNALGMTDEQIAQANEAREKFKTTMEVATGAALWQAGLGDLMDAVINITKIMKKAFMDVFFPEEESDKEGIFGYADSLFHQLTGVSKTIYRIIVAFKNFSEWLKNSTEDSEILKNVFRGIFSVADLLLNTFLTIRRMKFRAVLKFFEGFGVPIQDAISWLGDLIFKFHAFIQENDLFGKAVDAVGDIFYKAGEAVRFLFDSFIELPSVQNAIDTFKDGFSFIGDKVADFFGISTKEIDEFGDETKSGFTFFEDAISNLSHVFGKGEKDIEQFKKKAQGMATIELEEHQFTQAADVAETTIWSIVTGIISAVFGVITETVTKAFNFITEKVSSVWAIVTDSIRKEWPNIQEAILNWFETLPEKFGSLTDKVGSFFSTVWGTITSALSTVWTDVSSAVAAAWPTIKEGFGILWQSIKDWFANTFSIDLGILEKAFEGIKEAIKIIAGTIGVLLGGSLTVLLIALGGLIFTVQKVWGVITNFYNSIANNEKVKAAANKIKGVFTKAFDKITFVVSVAKRLFDLFMWRLEQLGGFSFENLVKSFTFVTNAVGMALRLLFPEFREFLDKLEGFKDKVGETLANLGLDSEGLKSKWDAFSGFAVDAFSTIYNGAKSTGSKVLNAIKNFFVNPIVQANLERFKQGFKDLWASLGPWFSGFKDAFKDFMTEVENLGGFSFNNIGGIFEAFKNTIWEHFKSFTGFDTLKEAFAKAWDDVKSYLKDNGVDIDGIKTNIQNFINGLPELFNSIKGEITGAFDNFTGFDGIKAALENSWGLIKQYLEDNGIDVSGFEAKITEWAEGVTGWLEPIFTQLWENIKKFLEENGIDVDTIVEKLKEFGETLRQKLDELDLFGFFGDFFDYIVGIDLSDPEGKLDSAETQGFFSKLETFFNRIVGIVVTATQGFSIPDALANFLDTFVNTKAAIDDAAEGLGDEEGSFKSIVIGFVRDLYDIVKELHLPELVGLYGLIRVFQMIGDIAGAAKAAKKALSRSSRASELWAIAGIIGALDALIAAIALQANFGDAKKFAETAKVVGKLVGAISGIITAASILIEHLGTGLPSGGPLMAMTSKAQAVQNILTTLINKGFILGLIGISTWALKELVTIEDFDGEQALKAAESITLMGGVFTAIAESIGILGRLKVGPAEALKGMEAIGVVLGIGAGATIGLGVIVNGIASLYHMIFGEDTKFEKFLRESVDKGFELIGKVVEGFGEVVGKFAAGVFNGFNNTRMENAKASVDAMVKFVEAAKVLGDDEHTFDPSALENVIKELGKISWQGIKLSMEDFLGNLLISEDQQKPMYTRVSEAMTELSAAVKSWETNLKDIDQITLPDGLSSLAQQVSAMSDAGLHVAFNEFLENFGYMVFNSSLEESLTGHRKEKKSVMQYFSEAIDDIITIVDKWNEHFGAEATPIAFDKTNFDALVESVKGIPDGGLAGLISRIFGVESSTGQFASDMAALATGISDFSTNLDDGITDGEKMNAAIKTISAFAALTGVLKDVNYINLDNFVALLGGEGDKSGKSFADALNHFYSNLKINDPSLLVKVARSAKDIGDGITSITSVEIKDVDFSDTSLIWSIASNIETIVNALTYTALGDYSSIDAFVSSVEKIAGASLSEAAEKLGSSDGEHGGEALTGSISKGVTKGSSEVSTAVSGVVSDAGDSLENADSTFISGANTLVAAMADAFTTVDNLQKMKDAAISLIDTMTAKMRLMQSDFTSVGDYLAAGLAGGMVSFTALLKVTAAAWAIGKAALKSLKLSIDSKSPSKEAAKIGGYFGEGFVIGMDDYIDTTYREAFGIGSAAVRGLKSSVRAINAMMEDGLETQPVIRPVLDLTNLQNGTATLNGMLGTGGSIGIAGDFNAINANVNARNMTTNGDILAALNELGSALSARPSQTTTYNVNGITYDDGSNVSSAIRSLIHAAQIERRV